MYRSVNELDWFSFVLSTPISFRYCFTSSNIGLRQLSTSTTASFILSFSTLITFLVNIHLLIFYRILLDRCVPSSSTYERFFHVYRLLIHFLIPLALMSTCWILILKNFYQSRRRLSPFLIDIVYNHQLLRTKRQMNNEILRMLYLQCLLWLLANILQMIAEIFFFLSSSFSFFFFVVSSQLFRQQLPCILSWIWIYLFKIDTQHQWAKEENEMIIQLCHWWNRNNCNRRWKYCKWLALKWREMQWWKENILEVLI